LPQALSHCCFVQSLNETRCHCLTDFGGGV
jgi:hypothetical protein